MLNRNSSDRTAAQKSSKCSFLFRPATIAAILMLAAVFCQSCTNDNKSHQSVNTKYTVWNSDFGIIEIDSCEYVVYGVGMNYSMFSHKGNCKYCTARKSSK